MFLYKFILFVLQLSWFKIYTHADAKQKNKDIALAYEKGMWLPISR
jgi:hypothetical protein